MNTFLATYVVLPVWIVTSQWVLLFALGGLVIVAYRQLGYTLHLEDIGSDRDGLSIGEQAPIFTYTFAHHRMDSPSRFEVQGQWSLLLFADPGCISCQNALVALEHLLPQIASLMQILVATTADITLISAVEEFRISSVNIGCVDKDVAFKLYHTYTTPFMYIIDPKGVIQAKGFVKSEADIQKLIRKVDHGVIQVASRVR